MDEALDAIHDVALKLSVEHDLPEEVQEGLDLIISIARYKEDIRSDAEKEKFAGDN